MVSMNSNLAYIRYHLWRDRNFLILYTIFLICVFPLFSLGVHTNMKADESRILMLILFLMILVVMAILLPIYLFRFLWDKRESDLYACICMKRKTLFANEYGIGILYLYLLPWLAMFLTILLMGTNWANWTLIGYIGKISCLVFVLYTVSVWIALICHSRLDAGLMVTSYFVIPFLLIFAFLVLFLEFSDELVYCQTYNLFMETLFTNPLIRWIGSILCVPSAMILLVLEIFIRMSTNDVAKNFWILPSGIWILWLAMGVIFYYGARRSFVMNKAEDAQSLTKSFFMYPLIISALTLSLFLFSFASRNYSIVNSPLIASFFLYFILWFVAQRRIRVRIYHIAVLIGLVVFVFFTKEAFLMSKGFGIIHEEIDENIDKLQVRIIMNDLYGSSYYMVSSQMIEEKKQIEQFLELQKIVIEDRKEQEEADHWPWEEGNYIQIDIIFAYYEDGMQYERYYTLFDEENGEIVDKYLEIVHQMDEKGVVNQEHIEGSSNQTSQWEMR